MAKKELTVQKAMDDFKMAYQAKAKLIEREREDFLFALGKQWDDDTLENYRRRGIKPVTDNRIQPNIFLLTGLERQNRSEFKAFPEGEEDTLKAEIASYLFKNAIKNSDFVHKTSEQFKDGIICGESHLELYLDNTNNLLNGKPMWRKADGNTVFPEPTSREYDFSDARYVYKITKDLSEDDLIGLYPDKKKKIQDASEGRLNLSSVEGFQLHSQKRDYPIRSESWGDGDKPKNKSFDLVERFYKKFTDKHYIGDKSTGTVTEAESKEKAEQFIQNYQDQIVQDQTVYSQALHQHLTQTQAAEVQGVSPLVPQPGPPEPPAHDPERFIHITRWVPEQWIFAFVPGMEDPLADEMAWYYPKWKNYPMIPYFARFSTAPLTGDDRHLLIQGIVNGVKNIQEVLNKTKTLELLHLNTSTNSGWLSEEDAWTDPKKVKDFGATPGVNLEYKKGSQPPIRLVPNPLSQAHAQIANDANDSIKEGLGINADLLAAQDGGQSSGRAIALRQRQGLLMVQELFDNLSRTRQIAGKFMLSQLGEMYDTETAKKVLGEVFIKQNFSVPQMAQQMDPLTGQPVSVPQIDPATGQPVMAVDEEALIGAISEVLSGDLATYDVAVGEAVSSETIKMANMADLKDVATSYPGIIPPELIIEEGMLPQATKTRVINTIKQAQAAAQQMRQMAPAQAGGGNGKG